MSSDRAIEEWLAELGYGDAAGRAQARAALEEAGLTRAGKQRMSAEKLPRAEEVLRGRFFLSCGAVACAEAARHSGRQVALATPRTHCEHCGGSDNHRAVAALVEACHRHGVRRVVVVGGSPSVREELTATLGQQLELRMVDGTERRTGDRARGDLEWADLVLVWGASELHHKVSWLYTQVPPPLKRKVVHVARRGIAALLTAGVEHLEGGRSR